MKKTVIIGLFAAGAGVLAYIAFIGDPAMPVGNAVTATLVQVEQRDNQGPDRLKPTGRWTAVTETGERLSGRSSRHADLAEGETVCLQRYRRAASGNEEITVYARGPCPQPE
ncbi:MAG: hypothetical protein AAFT19_07735 [Pseudomonadota bacterium]